MTDQTFEVIAQGGYPPANQGRFVDCLFDGWDSILNRAAPGQARVTKRADGYRVDSVSLTNKLMVAEVRDDGTFAISRMRARLTVTTLERETAAARECIARFGRAG